MSTKLHPIVREFFSFKSKRLSSLKFVKVHAHQDDIKSFEQVTVLEQLNVKCDARAKELILRTPEEEVITFPLVLSSAYVMNEENNLILNYPKDLLLHAHIIQCEHYLKKTSRYLSYQKYTGLFADQ